MEEIWKVVENHEDYEISNFGNVRNKHTKEEIKGDKNTIGYRRVTFYYGKKERIFVHRLVALHFVDGYRDGLVVNHIDGNKLNNRWDNLEWTTRSGNDIHAFKNNLRTVNKTCKRVAKIDLDSDSILDEYESIKEASIINSIDQKGIIDTCKNRRESYMGYRWEYL